VLLFTGGVKSWSVISALQDLGMVVVATGTKKSTEEEARIRELMGRYGMIDDGSPRPLKIVHDYKADIYRRRRNMYTALKPKVPFLDINQNANWL
jgi:nitrogenase molybdenum-cofactor synthesis protein NifE